MTKPQSRLQTDTHVLCPITVIITTATTAIQYCTPRLQLYCSPRLHPPAATSNCGHIYKTKHHVLEQSSRLFTLLKFPWWCDHHHGHHSNCDLTVQPHPHPTHPSPLAIYQNPGPTCCILCSRCAGAVLCPSFLGRPPLLWTILVSESIPSSPRCRSPPPGSMGLMFR